MSRTSGNGGSIRSNGRTRRTAGARKTSNLKDVKTDSVLFQNLTFPIQVARYHSLAVKEETLPEELVVTARSEDNEIMAMEHREYPIFGLQFHPESVMTPQGLQMIENFINYAKALKEN